MILDDFSLPDLVRPRGPLFHRWLPNGTIDAVNVPMRDNRNELTFWFDRNGIVDDGFIKYDSNQQAVDESIMVRQGRLDAGPLRGEARFVHVTSEELNAIEQDLQDSAEYIDLGKRVVNFLFPAVSAFVEVLRVQYGQYWLREVDSWDSRRESLGSYCATTLGLCWRVDPQSDWRRFTPTAHRQILVVERLPRRGFAEFLTETDWRELQRGFHPENESTIALRITAKAHVLAEQGHLNEALVQAVSGLELALDHFLDRRRSAASSDVAELLNQSGELSLAARLALVTISAALVAEEVLAQAVNAIKIRNKIVHEGEQREVQDSMLAAIYECVRALLQLSEFKAPTLQPTNELSPPTQQ